MKIMYRFLIALGVIAIFYVGMTILASELGGEVVELIRHEPEGGTKNIRLWIVDEDKRAWIEHGDIDSHWIKRLEHKPELSVIREGVEIRYIATVDAGSHNKYHELRSKKYGSADTIIELLSFGTSHKESCLRIPIRLEPQ